MVVKEFEVIQRATSASINATTCTGKTEFKRIETAAMVCGAVNIWLNSEMRKRSWGNNEKRK